MTVDLRAHVSSSGYELHGPVGRGKSFLADALFDVLPEPEKLMDVVELNGVNDYRHGEPCSRNASTTG